MSTLTRLISGLMPVALNCHALHLFLRYIAMQKLLFEYITALNSSELHSLPCVAIHARSWKLPAVMDRKPAGPSSLTLDQDGFLGPRTETDFFSAT